MTIYNACTDLVDLNVEHGRGEKIAFIDPEHTLTYAQLQVQTRRFANLLRRFGIRREERILLLLTDTVEFPIAFLGAIRAGVVPVPVNTMLAPAQYGYILDDTRARVLFVSAPLLDSVQPCIAQATHLEHVLVVGAAQGQGLDFASLLAAEFGEIRDRCDPSRRDGLLALFLGIDRRTERHQARPCKPDGDGAAFCARHS